MSRPDSTHLITQTDYIKAHNAQGGLRVRGYSSLIGPRNVGIMPPRSHLAYVLGRLSVIVYQRDLS